MILRLLAAAAIAAAAFIAGTIAAALTDTDAQDVWEAGYRTGYRHGIDAQTGA